MNNDTMIQIGTMVDQSGLQSGVTTVTKTISTVNKSDDLNIKIKASIDTLNAATSIKDLRANMKELTGLALEVGDVNSQAFKDITRAIGETKDKMGDLQGVIKSSSGEPIENLSRAFGGVKDNLLALDFKSAGAQFNVMKNSVKQLTGNLFGGFNALKVYKTAQIEGATTTEALSLATKGFGKALIATGIGAIVVLVGLLIANFDTLKESGGAVGAIMEGVGKVISFVTEKMKALLDWLGLMDFKGKKMAEDAKDRAETEAILDEKKKEAIKKNIDAQIEGNKELEDQRKEQDQKNKKRDEDDKKAAAEKAAQLNKAAAEKAAQLKRDADDAISTGRRLTDINNSLGEESLQKSLTISEQKYANQVQDVQLSTLTEQQKSDLILAIQAQELDEGAKIKKTYTNNQKDEDDKKAADDKEKADKKTADLRSDLDFRYQLQVLKAGDNNAKLLQLEIDHNIALKTQLDQDLANGLISQSEYDLKIKQMDDDVTQHKLDNIQKEKDAQKEKALTIIAKTQEYAGAAVTLGTNLTSALGALSDARFARESKGMDRNAKDYKKLAKESFERSKKLQVANAVMSGIMGAVGAFSQALATLPAPAGAIVGAASAALIGITTAANVSKIKSTTFDGGGSTTPNAPPPVNIPAPNTIGLGEEKIALQRPENKFQRVYVTEGDIRSTTGKVEVIESRSKIGG